MPHPCETGRDGRLRILLTTLMPHADATHGLAMRTLKSYLLHRGPAASIDVTLKTFSMRTAPDVAVAQIAHLSPQVVGFSTYTWNGSQVIEISRRMRASPSRPRLLLAGGPEVDHDPESFIREGGLDLVVLGEGEEALRRIVEATLGGADLDEIPNLVLRKGDSTIVRTRQNPVAEDIASHDMPLTIDFDGHWAFKYESSRGCQFRCRYCKFDRLAARTVRYYPLEKVQADLGRIFAIPQLKEFQFVDSTFFRPTDRDRGLAIMETIHRLNAGRTDAGLEPVVVVTSHNVLFLDAAARATLSRLPPRAGTVHCGLQTIDERVNREILDRGFNRFSTLQRMEELSRDLGDRLGLDLIFGLPGDTLAGYRRSLEFVLGLGTSHASMFHFHVLPGTYFWNHPELHGLRYESRSPHRLISSNTWSKDDLLEAAKLSLTVYLFHCEYFFPRLVPVKRAIREGVHGQVVPLFDRFRKYLEQSHKLLFDGWVKAFRISDTDWILDTHRFLDSPGNAGLVERIVGDAVAIVRSYAAEQRRNAVAGGSGWS